MDKFLKPNYKEFIFNNEEYENFFSESFFYSPETFDEETLGYLFLVGKVKSKLNRRQEPVFLLNYLASKLSQNYYTYVDYKIKDALSNSLQILNKLVTDLYEKKEIDWLQDMFLASGVIKEKLYFSFLNKGSIFLLRDNEVKDLWQDMIFEKKDSIALFDKILKTDIQGEDKILVTTPLDALSNIDKKYFKDFDLFKKNIIRTNNKSLAVIYIDFNISKDNQNIANNKKIETLKVGLRDTKNQSVFRISFKSILNSFKIKKVFKQIKLKPINLLYFSKNTKLSQFFKGFYKKIAVFLIVVAVLLFIGFSVYQIRKESLIQKELQVADAYVETFYSFNYDASQDRRRFLNEARVIYEKYKDRKIVLEKLKTVLFFLNNLDYAAGFNKIKIIDAKDLSFLPQRVLLETNNLILTNGSNFSQIDLLNEKIIKNFNPYKLNIENNSLIFISEDILYVLDQKLLAYDFKIDTLKNYSVDLSSKDAVSIFVFDKNLYILTTKGQVYKYSFSGHNIIGPKQWLNDKNVLDSPVSLGIDGNIFILTKDRISKFYAGKLQLQESLPQPNIKGIYVTKDTTDFFALWSGKYVYLLSKKDLKIQKIFINPQFTNIQDVIVDENGAIYILQGKSVIVGYFI